MSDRKQYMEEMQTKLDQWNRDINEFEKKARNASPELQQGYQKQVAILKDKRDEAAQKVEELQSATETGWDEVKHGMEHAWKSVSDSFSSAKTKLFGNEKVK